MLKKALLTLIVCLALLGTVKIFIGGLLVGAAALFVAGFKGSAITLAILCGSCLGARALLDEVRFH